MPQADNEVVSIAGVHAFVLAAEGPAIATERDAIDLIGATYGTDADLIVVPAVRLAADFFKLRTGLLGAIAQKFQNYQRRLAIVGDISAELARSQPFADYVRETNRGRAIVFVRDMDELASRLASK